MAILNWRPSLPRSSDYIKNLAQVVRSNKTALRTAMEEHFYWDVVGGTRTHGEPKRSTSTPGSARAFYGPRSEVSDPGRDGTLMVVSDESRVIAFQSGSSAVVGSYKALISGGTVTSTANSRVVTAMGTVDPADNSDLTVKYGVTYGSPPIVIATPSAQAAGSIGSYSLAIWDIGTSSFSYQMTYVGPGSPSFDGRFIWRSSGTVTS